jgi:hypothetical protein
MQIFVDLKTLCLAKASYGQTEQGRETQKDAYSATQFIPSSG